MAHHYVDTCHLACICSPPVVMTVYWNGIAISSATWITKFNNFYVGSSKHRKSRFVVLTLKLNPASFGVIPGVSPAVPVSKAIAMSGSTNEYLCAPLKTNFFLYYHFQQIRHSDVLLLLDFQVHVKKQLSQYDCPMLLLTRISIIHSTISNIRSDHTTRTNAPFRRFFFLCRLPMLNKHIFDIIRFVTELQQSRHVRWF